MNPSTTTLDLNVGYPSVATICHAVQGDIQSRIITANLYDGGVEWIPPAGAIGTIRFRTPLGTSGFYDTDEEGNTAVTWEGNVATLRIVQNAIAVAGDVPMQLSFYDGNGQVLTTFLWETLVQPSVLTDTQFMQTDYYNLLSQQISALIGATAYPPIINPTTRNWMLWDTETNSYVDSGYSSVGAKGDQGDQGVSITRIQRTSGTGEAGSNDTYTVYLSNGTTAGTFDVHNGSNGTNGTNGTNGLSIGRIEKTSGTGAAGTTDTYTVYLSDNTSVGTFTVYNGADGAGTPGTQLPLMDSDTASAGSENAYSREDHVHPRDSFLKGEIDDLQDIVGDGSLSGFTATDLTGAANELKGSVNTLDSNVTDLDGSVDSIQGQITANIQTTLTANKRYVTGDFLVYNGNLYRVTTTINSGATLTIGTNIETTTIGESIPSITEETCFASSAPTKLTAGQSYDLTLDYPVLSYIGYTLKLYSTATAQSAHAASIGEFRAVAAGDHTVPFYMDGTLYTLTYSIDYATKKLLITNFTAPNLYIHRIFGTVLN